MNAACFSPIYMTPLMLVCVSGGVFWNVLGEDILAVINNSLARGLMPLIRRRAAVNLLLKKKEGLQDVKTAISLTVFLTSPSVTIFH